MLLLEANAAVDDRERFEPIECRVEQSDVAAALARKHALQGLSHPEAAPA
jgi:hypothetical protein